MMDRENNMSWREFFGSKANLKRIALCTAVACFSQSTGNLLISNFLDQILEDTGLKTNFQKTMVNGMVTLWQYLVSIATGLLIDRFPRRYFFLGGCGASLVTFVVWTIAAKEFSVDGSLPAGRLVIVCIFLYQAFYTVAWVNLVVTYPLEIVNYQMRAKAWTYTLLVIQCSQIFGNYVNPVGMGAIGWKFYIYICVWTFVAWLVVYFFFPETRGPTLEELALLFEGGGNVLGHNHKMSLVHFSVGLAQKEGADVEHEEKDSRGDNVN
jgi:MFS family permease